MRFRHSSLVRQVVRGSIGQGLIFFCLMTLFFSNYEGSFRKNLKKNKGAYSTPPPSSYTNNQSIIRHIDNQRNRRFRLRYHRRCHRRCQSHNQLIYTTAAAAALTATTLTATTLTATTLTATTPAVVVPTAATRLLTGNRRVVGVNSSIYLILFFSP